MSKLTCYMFSFADGSSAANVVCSASVLKQLLSFYSRNSKTVSYYPHDNIHPDNLESCFSGFVALSKNTGSIVGFGYSSYSFFDNSPFFDFRIFTASSQLIDYLSKIHGVRS